MAILRGKINLASDTENGFTRDTVQRTVSTTEIFNLSFLGDISPEVLLEEYTFRWSHQILVQAPNNTGKAAITFRRCRIFFDSNTLTSSITGGLIRYTGVEGNAEVLRRLDILFEDCVFSNYQTNIKSAFGGNQNEIIIKMINSALDHDSGNEQVPFYGRNAVISNVSISRTKTTVDESIYLPDPKSISRLRMHNAMLKVKQGSSGLLKGVSFAELPLAQYYNSTEASTSKFQQSGRTDRNLTLIDCEVDETRAFATDGGAITIGRTIKVGNYLNNSNPVEGVKFFVLYKDGQDYNRFEEKYQYDISKGQTTVGDETIKHIEGSSTNMGVYQRELRDIGTPFLIGETIEIKNGTADINGKHKIQEQHSRFLILNTNSTVTSGSVTDVDIEVLPPVSSSDGSFSVMKYYAKKARTKSGQGANYVGGDRLISNTNFRFDNMISEANKSNDILYYASERFIRNEIKTVLIPPYPLALSIVDMNVKTNLSKDEAGGSISIFPVVINCNGIVETDPAIVSARTTITGQTQLVENLYEFKRKSENLHSPTTYQEFFAIEGDTINLNSPNIVFDTTATDVVSYDNTTKTLTVKTTDISNINIQATGLIEIKDGVNIASATFNGDVKAYTGVDLQGVTCTGTFNLNDDVDKTINISNSSFNIFENDGTGSIKIKQSNSTFTDVSDTEIDVAEDTYTINLTGIERESSVLIANNTKTTLIFSENQSGNFTFETTEGYGGNLYYVVSKRGYTKIKGLIVIDGSNTSGTIPITQQLLLDTDGSNMYIGSNIGIFYSKQGSKITGSASSQRISAVGLFDKFQRFLLTQSGCEWLIDNDDMQRITAGAGKQQIIYKNNINFINPSPSGTVIIEAEIVTQEARLDVSTSGGSVQTQSLVGLTAEQLTTSFEPLAKTTDVVSINNQIINLTRQ